MLWMNIEKLKCKPLVGADYKSYDRSFDLTPYNDRGCRTAGNAEQGEF